MNNKGQVLVIFVILLPIFLLILTFVIDYGLLSIEKRKIEDNTYEAVEYYLDNLENNDIYNETIKLIDANLEDVEINIDDNDSYVEIIVTSNYKSLYKSIMNYDLKVKYKGNKIDKKIIKG